jgi:hypothetical protein
MMGPLLRPSGRLRLVTRPNTTGALPIAKTIGIVVVAAFAASPAGVSTCRAVRPISSAPSLVAACGAL